MEKIISLTGSFLGGSRTRAPADLVCRGQAVEGPRQRLIQSHQDGGAGPNQCHPPAKMCSLS